MKKKEKVQTSKKLAWLSGICFIIVLIYSIVVFTYSTLYDKLYDFTMLITLITVTGAVFGTTCAMYYNKSRCENSYKIRRSYLKSKYLILKDIDALDELRIQSEIENELSKIECDLDNEESLSNQEITYNG